MLARPEAETVGSSPARRLAVAQPAGLEHRVSMPENSRQVSRYLVSCSH
jgi:hypothetical protein